MPTSRSQSLSTAQLRWRPERTDEGGYIPSYGSKQNQNIVEVQTLGLFIWAKETTMDSCSMALDWNPLPLGARDLKCYAYGQVMSCAKSSAACCSSMEKIVSSTWHNLQIIRLATPLDDNRHIHRSNPISLHWQGQRFRCSFCSSIWLRELIHGFMAKIQKGNVANKSVETWGPGD